MTRSALTRLGENLFAAPGYPMAAERAYGRLFEVLVLAFVAGLAWRWAVVIEQLTEIAFPIALARFVDLSWMLLPGIAKGAALLISSLAVLGLLGGRRVAYPMLVGLMHIQYVARFSMGKVGHGSSVVGIALVGLALGALLFRRREEMYRFAVGTTIFFVGLGYFTAAATKLAATGPAWVDGVHLWMWIEERSVDMVSIHGDFELNPLQAFVRSNRLGATAVLTFGLLTELAGPLLWFRRTRPFIAVLLIFMHVGVLATMQIGFYTNLIMVALVGFSWGRLIEWMRPYASANDSNRVRGLAG